MTKYFTKRLISSILLIVVFPIVTLRLLGFWQWMEWYTYDLLFYLSPAEPRDERVVLVVWDEKDLQISSEATINDQSLGLILEEIKQQQPRWIGLDIYRDIPVTSRLLSKEEDLEAYNRLQEIFLSTPNLIGIEKIRNPIIKPNPVLKKEQRTASSDVITDPDNVIRRSFINTSSDYSYIGTALGYLYLAHDGWNNGIVDESSLLLFKNDQKIILRNLKHFDGGYINNKVGWDFLINWRRGSSLFTRYSVEDIKTGKVPPDAFRDKIVLIGNISSSTSDLHRIPTSKWNKKEPWNYGVEIVAQITSSIISAGEDNRPLLRVAPWGLGYILMVLGIVLVTFSALKFANFSFNKLYLISGLFSLILSYLLFLLSLIAFQTLGWWIPIIPGILGIWLTFLIINYEIQINKEKDLNSKLTVFIGHLGHEIVSSIYAIEMNTEEIEVKTEDSQSVIDVIYDEFSINYPELVNNFSHLLNELNKNLSEFQKETSQIFFRIQKILRYKKRAGHYLTVSSYSKKREHQLIIVDKFIQQLVEELSTQLEDEYQIKIQIKQIYDPKLSKVKLDRLSLEVIIINLLENAYTTIVNKYATTSNYSPKLTVQAKKRRNWLKNWVEISIEDNGEGIPKALKNKIFNLGVSGKSAAEGQGMGLFLVKQLLDIEQGKIRVESEVGKGSKFIVLLPKK